MEGQVDPGEPDPDKPDEPEYEFELHPSQQSIKEVVPCPVPWYLSFSAKKDAADALNCTIMDVESGKVPYRLYLQAVTYASAKSRVMPFLEDSAKLKAELDGDRQKRRDQMRDRPSKPPPGKKEPLAKKI